MIVWVLCLCNVWPVDFHTPCGPCDRCFVVPRVSRAFYDEGSAVAEFRRVHGEDPWRISQGLSI